MAKFYTRTGDSGTTGFLGEGRLKKYDLRMETLGTLDELSASLGFLRSLVSNVEIITTLVALQRRLYELMAEVASSQENAGKFARINSTSVNEIEVLIDNYSEMVEIPSGFIIPGDTPASAAASLARTIARRAERRAVELSEKGDLRNPDILGYLNRLSSFLFILEIRIIQESGSEKPLSAKVNTK